MMDFLQKHAGMTSGVFGQQIVMTFQITRFESFGYAQDKLRMANCENPAINFLKMIKIVLYISRA
jgi:hypothetical protein